MRAETTSNGRDIYASPLELATAPGGRHGSTVFNFFPTGYCSYFGTITFYFLAPPF